MDKVAKFEKISFGQFMNDFTDAFGFGIDSRWLNGRDAINKIREIYDGIRLPRRATQYSAGYDFYSPIPFVLNPGETIKIPTGIRIKMEGRYVLLCFPRSGLGFKYRLQLNNTVGVIDADYYNSDNEGHIFAKVTNDTNEGKTLKVEAGDGFMQGILIQYGITMDDDADGIRNGGVGSTVK